MRRASVPANSVTCSVPLKLLTVHSHHADVKRVVDLIDNKSEHIGDVLFSSVIDMCIRIKHLDLLSDLIRRYRQKSGLVNLTAPTYESMIKAYCQAGDAARVRELWPEMEGRGVKRTGITLGCLTQAFVTNGESEEAWWLIDQHVTTEERRGGTYTVIYSSVLNGFAVARRIDKVFRVAL